MGIFQGGAGLKPTGACWTWGLNSAGQLGDGTITTRSSPVNIVGGHVFTKITATLDSMAGLKTNGSVWTWGEGDYGKLGDLTQTDKSSPVSVVGGHSFVDIIAGRLHVLGLKADGSCWSWGANQADGSGGGAKGQLGDYTTTNRSSPVSVVGAHSFVEIAAGGYHSLGRKADGSVWAWGMSRISGAIGQIGDYTGTDRSSPVSVVGNHSFIQITGGTYNSHALKSNGQIWSWGYNAEGELADNTANSKSSPVLSVGGHSFVQVAAGSSHVLGRKQASIWSWGLNTSGQLGDQTIITRSSPVAVVGSHWFAHVFAGSEISYGRKAPGEVWSWGAGPYGQLGNGAAVNRSSPVMVIGLS